MSPGTALRRRVTSVDFPLPDGAEMMNTVLIEAGIPPRRRKGAETRRGVPLALRPPVTTAPLR